MYGFACCPRTTSSACQKFPYLCTYMRAHIYAHSLKRISFAQMTSLWVGQLSFEYAIKDLKTAMGTALVCTSLKWAVKTTMGGLKLLVQRAIARRQALDLFHSPILGSGTFKALQWCLPSCLYNWLKLYSALCLARQTPVAVSCPLMVWGTPGILLCPRKYQLLPPYLLLAWHLPGSQLSASGHHEGRQHLPIAINFRLETQWLCVCSFCLCRQWGKECVLVQALCLKMPTILCSYILCESCNVRYCSVSEFFPSSTQALHF